MRRFADSTAERVQAVVVLAEGTNVDDVVREANTQAAGSSEDSRRRRRGPSPELPRTEGTKKLKRRELRQWLIARRAGRRPRGTDGRHGDPTERHRRPAAVSRPAGRSRRSTTIDELGLSSLERVELMMALEEALQITVDEGSFAAARTVADLEALGGDGDTRQFRRSVCGNVECPRVPRRKVECPVFDFPSWNRSGVARALRRISLPTWILPLSRPFMSLDVEGLSNLDGIEGPVIFAANHQSHFDAPAILRALPPRWRYRLAPAMAKEFFRAHFRQGQFDWKARLPNSANYYLSSLFFNAFPLPQREAGTRQTLRYIGTLMSEGYSLLIFPEGQADGRGRDQPVSGWGRYDCIKAGRSRSSPFGSTGWTVSSTNVEVPANGAAGASFSAGLCP